MATTGIVHGCTLSYTRALADWEVLRWRNINSPFWDTGDMNLLFGGLGTLVGMQAERHVMGGGSFLPRGKDVDEIRAVLDKYDTKTTIMKAEYAWSLVNMNPIEEFYELGWILTDYCPDGFDGKQLTMATYI